MSHCEQIPAELEKIERKDNQYCQPDEQKLCKLGLFSKEKTVGEGCGRGP